MKETQEILEQMGFVKTVEDKAGTGWESDWFGFMRLTSDATPNQLARYLYNRGVYGGERVADS